MDTDDLMEQRLRRALAATADYAAFERPVHLTEVIGDKADGAARTVSPRWFRVGYSRANVLRIAIVVAALALLGTGIAVVGTSRRPATSSSGGNDVLLAIRRNALDVISPTNGAVLRHLLVDVQSLVGKGGAIESASATPNSPYAYALLERNALGLGTKEIVRIAISSGHVNVIARFGEDSQVQNLAVSPDGNVLAFDTQRFDVCSHVVFCSSDHAYPMQLVLLSTTTGVQRRYEVRRFVPWFMADRRVGLGGRPRPRYPEQDRLGAIAWSPNGDRLLLVPERYGAHGQLVIVDLSSLSAKALKTGTEVGNKTSSATWEPKTNFLLVGEWVFCPGGICSSPYGAFSGDTWSRRPLVQVAYPSGNVLRTFPFLEVNSVVADPTTGEVAVSWYLQSRPGHPSRGSRPTGYGEVLGGSQFQEPAGQVFVGWVHG